MIGRFAGTTLNGIVIWANGKYINNKNAQLFPDTAANRFEFKLAKGAGKHAKLY
jgi:hypothetical protein